MVTGSQNLKEFVHRDELEEITGGKHDLGNVSGHGSGQGMDRTDSK